MKMILIPYYGKIHSHPYCCFSLFLETNSFHLLGSRFYQVSTGEGVANSIVNKIEISAIGREEKNSTPNKKIHTLLCMKMLNISS